MTIYPLTKFFDRLPSATWDLDFFDDFDYFPESAMKGFRLPESRKEIFPALNLYEKDDSLIFRLDAPGFKKEDLKVELLDSNLKISGQRKYSLAEDAKVIHQERSTVNFTRSYRLPDDVKPDSCVADYKDGVLEIRLEKSESSKPKLIAIQ